MQKPTKEARMHLHAMVSLANTLLSESLNQNDPVLPPERTISKEEFIQQYNEHSSILMNLMDNLETEDEQDVNASLQESRLTLMDLCNTLQAKLDKLNNLRFWIDNMIFDSSSADSHSV